MAKTLAQRNAKRGKTLRLLRKIHGWLGLWGALLGLLFGVSGFLLNHRTVMKIPAAQMEVTEIELQVPSLFPKNRKEFATFIQAELDIQHAPSKPRPQKGRQLSKVGSDAKFMNKSVKQPETLELSFNLPQARVKAAYVVGNKFATVKREETNAWGFIMRMHKGVGANVAWVLLADSIAGAILILSITGVLLWTKMRGSRLITTGLIGISTVLTFIITLSVM